jgi:hypothetical protein
MACSPPAKARAVRPDMGLAGVDGIKVGEAVARSLVGGA